MSANGHEAIPTADIVLGGFLGKKFSRNAPEPPGHFIC